jgi:hypothetical protein
MMLTRADMTAINEKSVTRALKYLGTCPNSKGFKLNIVLSVSYNYRRVSKRLFFFADGPFAQDKGGCYQAPPGG